MTKKERKETNPWRKRRLGHTTAELRDDAEYDRES